MVEIKESSFLFTRGAVCFALNCISPNLKRKPNIVAIECRFEIGRISVARACEIKIVRPDLYGTPCISTQIERQCSITFQEFQYFWTKGPKFAQFCLIAFWLKSTISVVSSFLQHFDFRIISKKRDFENRFSLYSKISFIRGPPAFSKVAIPLCRTLSLSQFSIKAMSLSLQSLSSIENHSINMKVNNSKLKSGHHQKLFLCHIFSFPFRQ